MAQNSFVILVPIFVTGDATGTDAFLMSETLRRAGHDVRIFAKESEPELGALASEKAASFLDEHTGPVIYHLGTDWDHGMSLIRNLKGPLLIRDHNVTPSAFFEGVDGPYFDSSEAGIRARESLARRHDAAKFLPCSQFSADELQEMGVDERRIAVLPPFHEAPKMEELEPDPEAHRRWSEDPADVLFVGRIAPNKGHRDLLRISALHRELFGKPLRLRFVGRRHPRLTKWERLLRRDAARLGLRGFVDFVGDVTRGELKSAYLTSRVFVSASEHEGFCVPLVEASWLGLPIVASFQEAVRETLGPSGLVFPRERQDEMATAIHRLLMDDDEREAVARTQRSWVKDNFSTDALARRFLSIAESVLP